MPLWFSARVPDIFVAVRFRRIYSPATSLCFVFWPDGATDNSLHHRWTVFPVSSSIHVSFCPFFHISVTVQKSTQNRTIRAFIPAILLNLSLRLWLNIFVPWSWSLDLRHVNDDSNTNWLTNYVVLSVQLLSRNWWVGDSSCLPPIPAYLLLCLPFPLPRPCPSPAWSGGPGCHFFILQGGPKKSKPPSIFRKIVWKIANEIRFFRKVKVWIKHYNTIRW